MISPATGIAASKRSQAGFSLIELITVFLIITILGLMLFPVFGSFQSRSEKLNCISNLKTLHSATQAYIQDNQQWPQIPYVGPDDKVHPQAWIKALSKYGVVQTSWICPSVQREAKSPDLNDPNNVRIDYFPSIFDRRASTPYRYMTHPWFLEKGGPHGSGNLIIYADGRVDEMLKAKNVN